MPDTFDEAVTILTTELRDLLIAKQISYGKGNIKVFGVRGVLVRASDKYQRLMHLIWDRPDQARDAGAVEAIEDTWKDWSNYGIIGLMLERGWWDLPLKRDFDALQAGLKEMSAGKNY